jgi:hypothetical protein
LLKKSLFLLKKQGCMSYGHALFALGCFVATAPRNDGNYLFYIK